MANANSLPFTIRQDKSEGTTRSGKWYAKNVFTSTLHTRDLAKEVEANCTVTEADCLAVINSLVKIMTHHLQNGHICSLDDFGAFKLYIKGTGAEKAKDFSAGKHIRGCNVRFLPEYKMVKTGELTKKGNPKMRKEAAMTTGVTFVEV